MYYAAAAAAATKLLQSCPTVRPHGQQPTRLLHPWDSPGKNSGDYVLYAHYKHTSDFLLQH